MGETPPTRPSLLIRLRDPQDGLAWEEFLEIYTPLVYGLARSKGLQHADASDLAQDVFRAVAGAIDRWDPDPARGSFRSWLSRIARNLTINLLTSQGRHPRGSGDADMKRFLEQQPAPGSEESARFDAEFEQRVFTWAAEQVRPEFSDKIWLAFWRTGVEGRAVEEVARELGVKAGTVYHYKCRVLARLREKVQQTGGE